jgi:1-acyl-sn-glycerol-3-phosphate acyltransferase
MNCVGTAPRSLLTRPSRLLWGLIATAATLLCTAGLGALAIGLTLATRRSWPTEVLGPVWSRWILKVCGIGVDIEGLERVDRQRSYIISNHLSDFDIWATLAALPLKICFIAKKELLRVPIFGQALALSGHIIIDRSNPEAAIARINERMAGAIGRGFCILFYAEGTRSPDGKIRPFKKGGATVAIRTGLPIIPLSISGTRKFLPKRSALIRPGGRVKIVLGEPIETADYPLNHRDALNDLVRGIVIKNYVEDY